MGRGDEFRSSGQFLKLYHGTDSYSADEIGKEGMKANPLGVVYGSEDYGRAEKRARERTQEVNEQSFTQQSPRMVEFWAHRDYLTKPWSQRHDWSHSGDVPVQQIHSIYEIDE